MKDFLRDNLKYKEIPSKPQEKDPYHPHSLDFAYFYMNVPISDLPTLRIHVQTFFLEKVWLRNILPTYNLRICPKFRSFF